MDCGQFARQRILAINFGIVKAHLSIRARNMTHGARHSSSALSLLPQVSSIHLKTAGYAILRHQIFSEALHEHFPDTAVKYALMPHPSDLPQARSCLE